MSPLKHRVAIYYTRLLSRLWFQQGPRMSDYHTIPMLERIDRNNQIFLIKNIRLPSPSFDIFVILCHFKFHPLVKIFQISLKHQDILS